MPLTFTFGGKFNNLSDFFHRLKRFVHIANNKISVQGRLITIDSLKFTSSAQNFPNLEADVSATVYLSPKDGGTTAGATSTGPATTTPGATTRQLDLQRLVAVLDPRCHPGPDRRTHPMNKLPARTLARPARQAPVARGPSCS